MFSLLRYKQDTDMHGQQRTLKINTVLTTGHKDGSNIYITLCGKQFYLQSVIFHQGKLNKISYLIFFWFFRCWCSFRSLHSHGKKGDWLVVYEWPSCDKERSNKSLEKQWKLYIVLHTRLRNFKKNLDLSAL